MVERAASGSLRFLGGLVTTFFDVRLSDVSWLAELQAGEEFNRESLSTT